MTGRQDEPAKLVNLIEVRPLRARSARRAVGHLSGAGGAVVAHRRPSAQGRTRYWQPPTGGGPRDALAFLCDSPTDVDRIYEMLIEAGGAGHLPPFDAPWGQRYATVHDHDGNAVDLFAPL